MDQIYRLRIRGALHVGSTGIGKEGTLAYVPSDSLFAALTTAWSRLEPDTLDDLLEPFARGQPPFLVSSAFPYAGAVRLYPTPVTEFPLTRTTRDRLGKKLKRIGHVSEQILLRWLQGELLEDELSGPGPNNRQISNFIQGGVWVTSQEREQIAQALGLSADEPDALRLWGEMIAPHVVVGRIDNRPNLFHTGRVHFAPHCGLWFGVRGADDTWIGRIERALSVLADGGLGGLRSTGHGAFAWDKWQASPGLTVPAAGGYGLLLSRLAPTKEQMPALIDKRARYRLVTVGGWCGNEGEEPRKRRRVRLLAEGSVVAWQDSHPGQLVDVNPTGNDGLSHPVYRYGYGLATGMTEAALEERQ